MDLATTISFIVAAGSILGVISGYIGYAKGAKKDSYSDGRETGSQHADIDYIKKRTDDILLEQRDTNRKLEGHARELSDHGIQIARLEESVKSAHHRITTVEEKVDKI